MRKKAAQTDILQGTLDMLILQTLAPGPAHRPTHHRPCHRAPFGRSTTGRRDKQQAFAGTFAWSANQRYVGRGSGVRHFDEMQVSGDFFRVLGVRPLARAAAGCPKMRAPARLRDAVVSYRIWQSELGGRDVGSRRQVVRRITICVEIVGVTPPEFFGMAVGDNFDIALPFCRPSGRNCGATSSRCP